MQQIILLIGLVIQLGINLHRQQRVFFRYICQTPLGRYFPLRGENRKAIGTLIGKYYGNILTSTNTKDNTNLGNCASVAIYYTFDGSIRSGAIVLSQNWVGRYGGGEIRPFIYF